jgi:fructose transport system permease protein
LSNPAGATLDLAEEFRANRTPLQRLQVALHRYPYLSPLVVLVVALIIFSLINPRFILPGNLSFITQQAVVIGTLAIAQTLIILTAGIDLSIGAIMVFGQMVMANLALTAASNATNFGLPPWLAIIIGICASILAGAINGFLIVKLSLPPFIVTLGTLSVFTALTLILFKARTIQGPEMPDLLKVMGVAIKIGSFQLMVGVIVMLALFAIFTYVLRMTSWGTHIYAVGDDPQAAELSGISTKRVLFSVYAVAGFITGIGAWIYIGRTGAASPNADPSINLDTITAVVIGGTSLFGGRGTLIGSLLGAFIVVVVENGLALAGLDQAYRVLAIGILVIAAVALDQWIRKVRA